MSVQPSRFWILCLGVAAVVPSVAFGGGWPTYRHDAARTGVASDALSTPLRKAWTWQSRVAPQPAWPGPARRDAWHKVDNLKPRVIFDWAFHVVADEQSVCFGSSADDKVYCLDAETGRERWSFFTDAPIRLAPTFDDGKLYVGSDDGSVYCLRADNGELIWRHRAAGRDLRVAGNGRVMSLWPVRTGVLVDGGVAYFAAGLFPFEGAFLCAVRADDGALLWKKQLDNVAPQGYLLASTSRLYVPTGRGVPFVFRRDGGEYLHALGGSGGAFCVLTDEALIYGPGKTGNLDVFPAAEKDQLASFPGNQIVVTPRMSYLHTDTELSALDRVRYLAAAHERRELLREQAAVRKELASLGAEATSERESRRSKLAALSDRISEADRKMASCLTWKRPCSYPYSLVLAGEVLVAGGTNEVAAFASEDGATLWRGETNGRALDLAVAAGRLMVSTDRGTIHCFAGK